MGRAAFAIALGLRIAVIAGIALCWPLVHTAVTLSGWCGDGAICRLFRWSGLHSRTILVTLAVLLVAPLLASRLAGIGRPRWAAPAAGWITLAATGAVPAAGATSWLGALPLALIAALVALPARRDDDAAAQLRHGLWILVTLGFAITAALLAVGFAASPDVAAIGGEAARSAGKAVPRMAAGSGAATLSLLALAVMGDLLAARRLPDLGPAPQPNEVWPPLDRPRRAARRALTGD